MNYVNITTSYCILLYFSWFYCFFNEYFTILY